VSRPVVSTRGLAKCFQALDDRCEVVLLVPSACQRLNDIARLEPPIPETLRPMPRDLALDEFPKDFGDRALRYSPFARFDASMIVPRSSFRGGDTRVTSSR